jgi:hypothetical protein
MLGSHCTILEATEDQQPVRPWVEEPAMMLTVQALSRRVSNGSQGSDSPVRTRQQLFTVESKKSGEHAELWGNFDCA